MNYRHAFHAGNFADVFKHVGLRLLLSAMHRKDKPFFYMDTHAGAVSYALDSEAARRTGEWRDGIGRLWSATTLQEAVADYVSAVREWPGNQGTAVPRVVPGSAGIAQSFLRARDRAVTCEALPEAARALRQAVIGDDRVAVHERDGYEALKALLPPNERRGVVLLDPPFEETGELDRLLSGLQTAHRRWATGVYALWYPIKDEDAVAWFRDRLARSGISRIMVAEFWPRPRDVAGRFAGCGLVIVNPPWQVNEQLRDAMACLIDHVGDDRVRAGYRVDWLAGE